MDWHLLLGAAIGAVTAVFSVSPVLLARARRRRAKEPGEEPLFLLRDGEIVDESAAGRELVDRIGLGQVFCEPADAPVWPRLAAALRHACPDFPAEPPDAATRCALTEGAGCELRIRPEGRSHAIALGGEVPGRMPQLALLILQGELDPLRETLDLAPFPVWRTDGAGALLWQNAAHDRLAGALGLDCPFRVAPTEEAGLQRSRVELADAPEECARWYEIVSRRAAGGWLHFALENDAVVLAEITQQTFVQTLAKTFSHLPTGLAIFDRTQRLVLFNPALTDLTGLPPEVLANRPDLMTFFDLLRERHVMPEPRDYASWRNDMARMVAAARDDRYSEIWSLPTGPTYRITGRPHPDGAVAFLIEDISDEITLTRRFRSELELSQSVIDAFEEAVAVFTASGLLALCNAGYRELWHCDPEATLTEGTVVDVMRDWQRRCRPTPVWGELRDFVTQLGERAGWDAMVTLDDGAHLHCRVEPIHAGATLVRFAREASEPGVTPPHAAGAESGCGAGLRR